MENPTQEIRDVVRCLTQGSADEQHRAIYHHFAPGASFEHPFCRVPSFKNMNAPGVGEIDSRAVITAIFRWYKILSPNIEYNIESIAMDEKASILYLRIFQVFSIWFIPFYRVPVRLTTMLHLAPASEFDDAATTPPTTTTTQPPPPYNATPNTTPEKHDAAQDKLHAVQEGAEPSYAAVASGEAAPPTPPAEQEDHKNKTTSHQQTKTQSSSKQTQTQSSSSSGSTNNNNSAPTRWLITKQEDLYQTSEFVKFLWLGPGASLAGLAQMLATAFCVFGVAAFGLVMQVLLPARPVVRQAVTAMGGKI